MTSEHTITIDFNGEPLAVEAGHSIEAVLQAQQIGGRFVVVRNDEIVPRSAYGDTLLAGGDSLEIMTPITGG